MKRCMSSTAEAGGRQHTAHDLRKERRGKRRGIYSAKALQLHVGGGEVGRLVRYGGSIRLRHGVTALSNVV